MEETAKIYNMALCEGRHVIPEAKDGAIFNGDVNPLDVDGLEESAVLALSGVDELNIYVTGLTVALIAALNACKQLGIKPTLYHYDREAGTYYPQKVKW